MNLVLDNLTKEFGAFVAVDHINLTMTNGVYGLLGVNGAGKTTLMRMLCTLLKPTSGNIYCNEKDIFKMDGEYRNLLGYLPQDFGFYPEFTVKDYLLYIATIKGIRPAVAQKGTKELIARVGLTKVANKKLKKLSGGMKRRTGIAQAMLNNPKILILDEPTAGLDPEERVRFRNLLSEIAENRIVILSTHIVGDIEAACEDIAIINEGSVIYTGTVSDLIKQAKGRVFTISASKRELPKLKRQLSITSMHTQGEQLHIRFIANNPPQGASLCDPNIEDAYMLYLHQNDPSFSAHAAGGAL